MRRSRCPGLLLQQTRRSAGEYVIISRGPGAEVLLEDEVLFVEPENVQALAQAIGETWNDDYRRKQIAAAGKRHADRCQGTQQLAQDIWNSSRTA